MLVVTGLGNQDLLLSSTFDEVMCSDICHNLRPRKDLGMEFLFQFAQRLDSEQ